MLNFGQEGSTCCSISPPLKIVVGVTLVEEQPTCVSVENHYHLDVELALYDQ